MYLYLYLYLANSQVPVPVSRYHCLYLTPSLQLVISAVYAPVQTVVQP